MISVWLRRWRRSPLLTAQFVVTIAVGMGVTTALVSLMLALGYQPLPYRDPNQVVEVWETVEPSGHFAAISGPDLTDFADASHNIFSALGGFSPFGGWLVDRNGATEIQACYIQASVLSDLGIRPVLGRGALPDDAPLGSGGPAPTWISYHLWQTRYGGSPSVIGSTFGLASSASGRD